jgi:hypothetical protein
VWIINPVQDTRSTAVRGLHPIRPGAGAFLLASIERSVREYFPGKEEKDVARPQLLSDVLRRDIGINAELK